MEKLPQLISDISKLENFIKVAAHNYNIDAFTARYLLKEITKMKERASK